MPDRADGGALSLLPLAGEGARLRRQDAEANGEAGPKGVPQERHVRRKRALLICFPAGTKSAPISPSGSFPRKRGKQVFEAYSGLAMRAAVASSGRATSAPVRIKLTL
ncbi:hypothetical protein GCM10009126_09510 [Rhodanobacter caeni]|uniref:Uncharacterized protein n=1 Tax=Rhodanobacter caeni TaxID=657654 RepID=A0ABN0UCE3_9GAMM